jgi:hypothetical protein
MAGMLGRSVSGGIMRNDWRRRRILCPDTRNPEVGLPERINHHQGDLPFILFAKFTLFVCFFVALFLEIHHRTLPLSRL